MGINSLCCMSVKLPKPSVPLLASQWADSKRPVAPSLERALWLLCKEQPLFWDCSPRDLLNRLTCKLLGEFRPQGGSRGLAWSEALASSVGRPDRGRCFPPHQAVGKGGE